MFGILADLGMTGITNMFADERQDDAQNFAEDMAMRAQNFNSVEAQKTRDFQERMRSTQYQTTVKDLAAAGLNPMLAYHQGGAGTPIGATAQGVAGSAGIASPGSSHSVAAGLQSASQIDVNDAITERTRAEAERARAETREIEERTRNYDPQRREIEARIPTYPAQVSQMMQNIAESAVRIERIWAEEAQLKSSARHLDQQVINLKAALPLIRTQIEQLKALAAKDAATTDEIKQRISANLPALEKTLLELDAQDRRMAQPQHEANSAASQSFVGQLGAYLRQLGGLPAIILNRRSTNIGTIDNRTQNRDVYNNR